MYAADPSLPCHCCPVIITLPRGNDALGKPRLSNILEPTLATDPLQDWFTQMTHGLVQKDVAGVSRLRFAMSIVTVTLSNMSVALSNLYPIKLNINPPPFLGGMHIVTVALSNMSVALANLYPMKLNNTPPLLGGMQQRKNSMPSSAKKMDLLVQLHLLIPNSIPALWIGP